MKKKAKKIIIFSHDFSETGAPHSAAYAAECLHNAGYYVEVWAFRKVGLIGDNLADRGIKTCILNTDISNDSLTEEQVKYITDNFDVAICNTIITHKIYQQLENNLPTIWWIRESYYINDYAKTNPDFLKTLKHASNIYVMNDYSKKYVANYNHHLNIIKHGMEDYLGKRELKALNSKMTFIMVTGYNVLEKGIHVFLKAINKLPEQYKQQSEFVFVLPFETIDYIPEISQGFKKVPFVKKIDCINDRTQMLETIYNADVVVVPSYSEPTSRVAIEGMMLGKPVILNENIGAKYLINNNKNGLMFRCKSSKSLCNAIIKMIENKKKYTKMSKLARQAYERNNSPEIYTKNLIKSINKVSKAFKKQSIMNKLFSKTRKGNKRIINLFGIKISYKKKKKEIKLPKSIVQQPLSIATPVLDRLYQYKDHYVEQEYDIYRDEKGIHISGNQINILGTSDNTLWTGDDVLCKEEYKFTIKEPMIMLDVGFNIGLATLYFARHPLIKKVYAFEPFTPTYNVGENNIKINPHLSSKIEIFNYGLGSENKTLDIHYNPELPGSMSSVKDIFSSSSLVEKIEIRNVVDTFSNLLKKHNEKIFMKIDCEGAEKEIIPALAQSGLLAKISVIIMEWHFESPQYLIDILEKNGFIVFSSHYDPNKLGLIRAIKLN